MIRRSSRRPGLSPAEPGRRPARPRDAATRPAARQAKREPEPRPPVPEPALSRLHALAGTALVILAASLAYSPSFGGPFLMDDTMYLTANDLIKATDGLYKFWFTTEAIDYWPVFNSSLWLEWRLWGMNPAGYHVTNLVLHIVEALLLWGILRRLSIPGGFLAALLFAVHPVNVESVAWITQRKNLLALLFFLLSILAYLEAEARPRRATRWYGTSLAAFVLAMLSKGSVAVLPVLLLGILRWLRPLTMRDVLRTVPFFLVSLVLVPVNMWFQSRVTEPDVRGADFLERLLGAAAVVWFYLSKALLPINLSFVYPKWQIHVGDLRWWLPLVAALATTGLLYSYRRSWGRPLLFAWGFFCVSLAPVMGFTDVGFMEHSLVSDHYQHVALIGVVATAAGGWAALRNRARGHARWLSDLAAVAVVALFTLLTWQHNKLFADTIALYESALERNPDSWMVSNNLGFALLERGRIEESMGHFERAIRLKDDYPEAHANLGVALLQTGRPEEATRHFERTLRSLPQYPNAHYNLGNALVQTGRRAEAIGHFEQALRLQPDHAEAHNNLAGALLETGRPEEAIEHYGRALQLQSDIPEGHHNMGKALFQAGRTREAIEQFEQAVRLTPDSPPAHNDLGVALAEAGRREAAIEHFRRALELDPAYANARGNLDETLAMKEPTGEPKK